MSVNPLGLTRNNTLLSHCKNTKKCLNYKKIM